MTTPDLSDLMQNDIDVLMSLDPLELSRQDLDRIIAYQRKMRGQREAGVKTKKPKGEGPKVDIKDLLASIPKPVRAPVAGIKRRV